MCDQDGFCERYRETRRLIGRDYIEGPTPSEPESSGPVPIFQNSVGEWTRWPEQSMEPISTQSGTVVRVEVSEDSGIVDLTDDQIRFLFPVMADDIINRKHTTKDS